MKDTTTAAPRDQARPPGKRGRPSGQAGAQRNLGEGASADAKRLAAAILEVLAGARTPTEAAQALEQVVPEERGGPFVETTGGTEFAEGTDASNPKGAKPEPFPTA